MGLTGFLVKSLPSQKGRCQQTPSAVTMASKIDSKKAFATEFPTVRLDKSVQDPSASSRVKSDALLDYDVLFEWLSGELGCQLKLTQHVTELRHEKTRFFLVYEVLKSFAKFSQGRLLLHLKEQVDDDQGLRDSGQPSSFEHCIQGQQIVSSTTAFVVVMSKEPEDILLTVGVNENIANPAYLWQTLAELIHASDQTGSGVCAAMTDAFNWRFFESRRENDSWVVYGSRSVPMFDLDLNSVQTTNEVFSIMLSHLFPGQQFPSLQTFRQVGEAARRAMKRDAKVLAQSIALELEIAKVTAEKDRTVAELREELDRTKCHKPNK